MDLSSGKITESSDILNDFIDLINRSRKLKSIKLVDSLENSEDLTVDTGYSTRAGYDRGQLKMALRVLAENVSDPRINDIFDTSFSEEELKKVNLLIDKNSIQIKEEFEYSDNSPDHLKDIPEFVFLVFNFKAYLEL